LVWQQVAIFHDNENYRLENQIGKKVKLVAEIDNKIKLESHANFTNIFFVNQLLNSMALIYNSVHWNFTKIDDAAHSRHYYRPLSPTSDESERGVGISVAFTMAE